MKLSHHILTKITKLRRSPDLKKSAIYVSSSTIGFGIVLIQNFSLAFLASLEFFGIITILLSLFSTLYVVFTFGMNSVIVRYAFEQKYKESKQKLFSDIAIIWFLMGIIVCTVVLCLGFFLESTGFEIPIDYEKELVPVLFGAFLYSSVEIFPHFFIAEGRPSGYAKWLIGSRFTIFALLHISIFYFGESAQHIAWMLLISGGILFLGCVIWFRLYILSRLTRSDFREMSGYALPLMVYALGGIGYSHGYRLIISKWLSYEDLAIFTMANQIAMVYYLTAASFVIGFQPRAYEALAAQAGNPRAIEFYLRILLIVGVLLALAVLPSAYLFLGYFKDGAFYESFDALPILLLGQFVYLLYGYNYILCTFFKRTKYLTYAMAAGVLTSLLLSTMLIQESSPIVATIPVICGILIQYAISFILIRQTARKGTMPAR